MFAIRLQRHQLPLSLSHTYLAFITYIHTTAVYINAHKPIHKHAHTRRQRWRDTYVFSTYKRTQIWQHTVERWVERERESTREREKERKREEKQKERARESERDREGRHLWRDGCRGLRRASSFVLSLSPPCSRHQSIVKIVKI